MTRERYGIAPIFGIRPTGVPFDVLDRLGTPAAADAARALLAADTELAAATADLIARLPALVDDRAIQSRVWKTLKRGLAITDVAGPEVERYHRARTARHAREADLDETIKREYRRIHGELVRAGADELPEFLLIESGADATERLTGAPAEPSASHNSKDRQNDRTLALYLQRVCAKNDTLGRFGPLAWGTLAPGTGVHVHPRAGVAGRRIEVERWVVKALIAQMNAEPDVRAEVAPRLHPHGLLDGATFVRLDDERELALSDAERALAARCDGHTPAHALGEPALLEALRERGVLRWEVEPIAIDASPLASLRDDVASWRDGAARARWLPRLDTIADLARRFGDDTSIASRSAVIAQLRALLGEIEIDQPQNQRTLYAARNPINENCVQAADITLGTASADAMLADAWPWFAFFADAIAWAASRVYRRVHEVIAAAPRRNGTLSYATLVRVARAHGIDLDGDGIHRQVGAETFEDVKRGFAARLASRADARVWQLDPDDCLFLRRDHAFPLGGELSYASADFQVSAASPADAAAGRFDWLVAELHFAPALLQHCMYWSCPDKPALHAAMAQILDGRPFCVRDSFTQAPVHVCGSVMTAMPQPTYVGAGRPKPGWRAVRPADAEVVVDEERCDVRLRSPAGEDLGSIIRTVRLMAGIHPFFPLERAPHEPRLRLGNVVVQREAWHVESASIGEPRATGVSAAFIAGIERVRAERGIPRWVFVRPAPGVLAGNAWFARDKDNKPLYVDLESVVFLDILERRLRKYGTLLFTEMLPTPQQLIWQLPDGRYPFELRTNIIPVGIR